MYLETRDKIDVIISEEESQGGTDTVFTIQFDPNDGIGDIEILPPSKTVEYSR